MNAKRSLLILLIGTACLIGGGYVVHTTVGGGSPYARFVYCVVAEEPEAYKFLYSPKRIEERRRTMPEQCEELDSELDGSDGADKGRVRWYQCPGIDCDEGWESRLKES